MTKVFQQKLKNALVDVLGHVDVVIQCDEVTLTVQREHIVQTLLTLRDDKRTDFHQLMDVCGIDFPDKAKRFVVAYQLLSLSHNWRLTVHVNVGEGESVPSVTSVYPAANWFEREVYDLYGVPFSEHPDLRRILTDYDFEGYPMRRDFPLSGHVQVRYDDLQRKVVKEPVNLEEPHRDYDTISPWQGVTDVQKRGGEG